MDPKDYARICVISVAGAVLAFSYTGWYGLIGVLVGLIGLAKWSEFCKCAAQSREGEKSARAISFPAQYAVKTRRA